MKNLLAVALVVSLTSIALSQNPVPTNEERAKAIEAEIKARTERQTTHFQKWEYKARDFGTGGGREAAKSIEATLNDLAKEGYELERVVGERTAIFRRQFKGPLVDRGPVRPQPAPGRDPKEDT